ncbi:MAG: DUF86 domain-containing protein [Planctomycetia bacterium]|nr:DUF86 domain-containing protein [Planctomycetia bacterium]
MSIPTPDRDLSFAADMLDAATKAVTHSTGKSRTDLDTDEVFQLAMLHLIQIVGEAATKTSPALRQQHPEIPWPNITGTRHRIVHDYSAVDLDVVWDVLTIHLPALIPQLSAIVPDNTAS